MLPSKITVPTFVTLRYLISYQSFSLGVFLPIHDPWANPEEVSEEHGFALLPSIDVRSCDAVVVAVAHQQFVEKSSGELISLCKDPKKAVLGDLKSVFGRVE